MLHHLPACLATARELAAPAFHTVMMKRIFTRQEVSQEQTIFAVQMHPERTEVNPRLKMGWHHSCRVTPLAFKNAFSHPFCMLGPVLPCQHQPPQIAVRIRWVPLATSHHHQPKCYFIHCSKKPSSKGFFCQSLGGSRVVNGMQQAEGPSFCPCL